ncbi:MAG: hypothetical protein ACI4KF_09760 [Huintestinicola sp.]
MEQRDDGVYPNVFDGDDYNVTFNAEHSGRDFSVFFQKQEDSITCFDNYQWDEIYPAAEKYIYESFPQGKIVDMRFCCKDTVYYYFMDKDSYFDGENIADILKNSIGQLKMVCYDTSFSQSEISEVIPADSLKIEFASFDTKEHCDEYYSRKRDFYGVYDFHLDLEKYAPYITDYLKMDKEDVSGFDVTIMENEEFRYAYFPVEPRKLVSKTSVIAEPVDKSKLNDVFAKHGEESFLSRPISAEYYFDSIFGDVLVYYPLEKLEGYDIENVGLAWFSCGGMSNNRNIEKPQICGEYAVYNMPLGEDYFMLVDTSGMGEYVPDYK